MTESRISLIAAIGAKNRVLGKDNQLLWHIPDDLKRFKKLTDGHPVIMGRKTWESLPEKYRPLPGRLNIIITRQEQYEASGAEICSSLQDALAVARAAEGGTEIFIIGGGEIFRESLPLATRLYLTLIDEEKEGNVFFPEYETIFTKKIFVAPHESDGLHYTWIDLER
ncbi:dihydrofolate reductase [Patescibacteria group bacterium]|nr:dihydrofolate reductase [Patescibacteria group bacterium]